MTSDTDVTAKAKVRDALLSSLKRHSTDEELMVINKFLVYGENPELVPSKLVAVQGDLLKALGLHHNI